MTWVCRTKPPAHTCEPPMWPVPASVQRNAGLLPLASHTQAFGHLGDLWRCDDCGKLWRVGRRCDACDYYGGSTPHRGQCTVGTTWREATLWQRIRNRRKR